MRSQIIAPFVFATTSAFLAFLGRVAIHRFFQGDPDPSAGPATFMVYFIILPSAYLSASLGLIAILLFLIPSRAKHSRIWHLALIVTLTLPGFAAWYSTLVPQFGFYR
jgi:hypothetical protein